MPERNLVTGCDRANRIRLRCYENPTNLQRSQAIFVLAIGLMVAQLGCSNIRQTALNEMPIPVLPSQKAFLDSQQDQGDLKRSAATSSDVKTDDQPEAVIVGMFDAETTSGVTLKATTQPTAPAPSLDAMVADAARKTKSLSQEDKILAKIENARPLDPSAVSSESHQPHQHDDQCDCLKKVELPKLAVVEPITPDNSPELFRRRDVLADDISDPSVQRVPPGQVLPKENQPIRLVALQEMPAAKGQRSASAIPNHVVPQTANKAQLLIPIPDKVVSDFKKKLAAAPRLNEIHVGPVEKTIRSEQPVEQADSKSVLEAKLPRQTASNIRVSALPFEPLRPDSHGPEPLRRESPEAANSNEVNSFDKVSDAITIREIDEKLAFDPDVETRPAEQESIDSVAMAAVTVAEEAIMGNFSPVANKQVEPKKSIKDQVSNEFSLEAMSPAKSEALARDLPAAPVNAAEQAAAKPIPTLPAENVSAVVQTQNQTSDESYDFDPIEKSQGGTSNQFVPAAVRALPDMNQIEEELADFEKANTFDPTTVNMVNFIDPMKLKAKLSGQEKKVIEPVAKPAAPTAKSLELRNPAFCTKISSFGQFTPFESSEFSSSQRTLLYCEVENQVARPLSSDQDNPEFETRLRGAVRIFDRHDNVVQEKSFSTIQDVARQKRRDFYVYFPLKFNDLAPGDYRLELTVDDEHGKQTAALKSALRFKVR